MQFINNFRGIAILMVLFVHTVVTMGTADSTFLFLISEPLRNCTILFVVVAGYLFSYQIDDFNYKRFLVSKVKTVIIPYIVISIPAIFIYLFGLKSTHFWIDMHWFNQLNPLYQYFYLMLTGAHLGPLWFIPMVVLFYLVSPLFIFIKRYKLLAAAFGLSLIPAVYFGRLASHESTIQAALYFLPAYLLGIVMADNKIIYKIFNEFSLKVLLIFSLAYLAIIFNYDISTSVDLLFKLALSVIVLSVCYQHLNRKNKVLDMFARLSFFLFFVHGYFVAGLKMVNTKFDLSYLGVLSPLLAFLFVVFMSISTFVVIKLIFSNRSKEWIGI